jgi:hypothetical protein
LIGVRAKKSLLQRRNKSRRFPVSPFRSRAGLKGDRTLCEFDRKQPQSTRRDDRVNHDFLLKDNADRSRKLRQPLNIWLTDFRNKIGTKRDADQSPRVP